MEKKSWKKGSEQKGIQPGECGRIRAKSCCSWGCATGATKRRFPFLLLQSVLPKEMDGPSFLATLTTPSHYSCNKWIYGAWEKPCKQFGKLRRQHLLPALPTDAQGNFTGPVGALCFLWAFPSRSSSKPWSFTLLPHPFLSSLIFVSAAVSIVTWIHCPNWGDYLEVIQIAEMSRIKGAWLGNLGVSTPVLMSCIARC